MADRDLRADVAKAASELPSTFGLKRSLIALSELLDADDEVVCLVGGRYRGANGLAALTDRRILFLARRLTSAYTEEVDLAQLGGVRWRAGLVSGELRVHAPETRITLGNVERHAGERFVAALRTRSRRSRPTR